MAFAFLFFLPCTYQICFSLCLYARSFCASFFFIKGLVVWITSKTWVTVEEINFFALLFGIAYSSRDLFFFGIQIGKV